MLKFRKVISMLIVLTMIIQFVNVPIYANNQLPVDDVIITSVDVKTGYHPITGEDMLLPRVTVSWVNPSEWEVPSSDGEIHSPDKYSINLYNMTEAEEGKVVWITYDEDTDNSYDLHDSYTLKTGCLYRVMVIPQHTHYSDSEVQLVVPSSNDEKYFITDLDVNVEADNKQIIIDWDDVGLSSDVLEYEIAIAELDYDENDSRQVFENNVDKRFTVSRDSSDVELLEGYNRLQYTIDNDIMPGRTYSLTVTPIYKTLDKSVAINSTPTIYEVKTQIDLTVLEDGEYIRFEWDISDIFLINDGSDKLSSTTLVEYEEGSSEPIEIVTFPGTNGAFINFYKIIKGDSSSQYQLLLKYESGYETSSNKEAYIPTGVIIPPTKPGIPLPLTDYAITELNTIRNSTEHTEQDYYDELGNYLVDQDIYHGDLEEIKDEEKTFHVLDEGDGFNLVWSNFWHTDYDETSDTYNRLIADFDVYYDIWVTNELSEITTVEKVISDLKFDKLLDQESQIITNDKVVGFKYKITQYVDPNEEELLDIVPNETYYIKIVAKKIFGSTEEISEPEFASIYFDYDGASYAPPVMSKPPLRNKEEELTMDSATIEWRKKWYEVSPNSDDGRDYREIETWEHEVWAMPNGDIYKEEEEGSEFFALTTLEKLNDLKEFIGVDNFEDNYISRFVDLGEDDYGVSDVEYYFTRLDYDTVQSEIEEAQIEEEDYDLTDYINDIIEEEQEDERVIDWKIIEPTVDEENTSILQYMEEGLEANKSYIFLLRPFRQLVDGEIAFAYYPAALLITTPKTDDELVPYPSVPYLDVISGYSDTEIKLKWDYNTDFTYELRYSKYEDIDDSDEITIESTSDEEGNVVLGEQYINDLFPDTTYYFWIRAISLESDYISYWSNAEMGSTIDVENPIPPRGVGQASEESMTLQGYDEAITEEYITIEWILDGDDNYAFVDSQDTAVDKIYSYILEVADNPQFLDVTRIEISEDNIGNNVSGNEILDKNLVKVNNLIANKVYYIRMQTKLQVTSDNDERIIEKTSTNYSDTIWLITTWSSDEYDGTDDPSKEILPDDNYEMIYDEDTKELEYRFRTNEIDEDGNLDNNVDQRLLSEIIEDNAYEYIIDVAKFNNELIEKRVIKIPDEILKALDEQQVNLVVDAGDIEVMIPHKALKDEFYEKMYYYGKNPQYQLTIDTWNDSQQKNNKPKYSDDSLSKTQQITLDITNEKLSYQIRYTEKPMTVKVRPLTRYSLITKEVDTYQYYPQYNKWERTNGEYLKEEGVIKFDTGVLGIYGIYASESNIEVKKDHWSETYRQSVEKKVNIVDLNGDYNPDAYINEKAIVNIIMSLAEENKDIQLNKNISKTKINQLYNAGIIKDTAIDENEISREEALRMFIKLYELKTGQQIYIPNGKYSNAEELIEKAYLVGMLSSRENVRSSASLTYGELFKILDIVIMDRGV